MVKFAHRSFRPPAQSNGRPSGPSLRPATAPSERLQASGFPSARGFDFTPVASTCTSIQRKPALSAPGDVFEREADEVADKVLRMPGASSAEGRPPAIMRQCSTCGDEDRKTIQTRRASIAGDAETLDTGMAAHAAARGGTSLSNEVRAYFEPRFGRDFSQVRVHADGEAATAARSVQARAFTLGSHVVFAAGEYQPSSRTGRHLLAHELTHVSQQGHAAVTHTGAWVRHAATPSVQRYLAGGAGHGGVEKDALEEAGLSKKESKLAYYGNWLRDLSQMKSARELIMILATGEFGHAPTSVELGQYMPTEHLDRPDGGESAEDPTMSAKDHRAQLGKLEGEQRRWADEEDTRQFRETIQQRVGATGLPFWIEAGKEHAKRKLADAIAHGRNPEGLRDLGNAQHAVEDYFAHSNFIEVALAQLVFEGSLPRANPLVAALGRYAGVDPANVRDGPWLDEMDPLGRPKIVTGTAVGSGGDQVSNWEIIKAEVINGELRDTFIKGVAIRYGWEAFGDVGRSLFGRIGGAIGAGIGAVGGVVRKIGGAIGGLFAGAGAGAAMGWSGAKHWWQKPFAAIGGLIAGGAVGAAMGFDSQPGPVAGARGGWRTGSRIGGAIGKGTFGAVGAAGLGVSTAALIRVASPILAAVEMALANRKIRKGTRTSIQQAPAGTGPTHSQIAKDDPDHPLQRASKKLAYESDVRIGEAVVAAWHRSANTPTQVIAVQSLVDAYVVHPQASVWWKPVLLAAAQEAAGNREAAVDRRRRSSAAHAY